MRKILISAAVIVAVIIGCKTASTQNTKVLKINFEPKSGSSVTGTGEFSETNGKVTFTARLTGLKPGVHAIHIHEKADCSAADGSSAGGHWNPTFKSHGKWGSASYHKGDIGNFTTDQNGVGTVLMTTDEWCIGCGDPTKDVVGKSVIVHEKADDFVTQPTGNAGGRMACSAIIQ